MTKGRAIACFIFLALVVGGIAYSTREPDVPRYQGKNIYVWLADLNASFFNDLARRHEAEKAIQSMGPKAAPCVVKYLRTATSPWTTNYRTVFAKLPSWLQRVLPPPKAPADIHTASSAFLAIGPSAKPALIVALRNNNAWVRQAAAEALGFLAHYDGTDIKDCVPALATCLQDCDVGVRSASALSLGYLGSDAAAAVPKLIPLLNDPQLPGKDGIRYYVRSAAARTLGKIGPIAKTALPALRPLLKSTDAYEASVAAIALWRIDSEVTNTLPTLIQGLNLVNEGSKWELVEGLSEMGPRGRDALPALRGQLALQGTANAPTPFTLDRITNALIKIDLDAALRVGIRAPSAPQSKQ